MDCIITNWEIDSACPPNINKKKTIEEDRDDVPYKII